MGADLADIGKAFPDVGAHMERTPTEITDVVCIFFLPLIRD